MQEWFRYSWYFVQQCYWRIYQFSYSCEVGRKMWKLSFCINSSDPRVLWSTSPPYMNKITPDSHLMRLMLVRDWYCSSSMTLTGQWTVLLMLEYCHLIVTLLYKLSHAEFSSNTIQRQEPNLKLTNCCKYQSSDPLQVSQLCCHCDRNISGQQRKHSLVQVNLWQSLFRVWWDDDVFVVW